MNAKEVLEKILKQRDDELSEYTSVFKSFAAPISSFQERIDKQKWLLTLELPVKTDTLSINRSFFEQFEVDIEPRKITREQFINDYYSHDSDYFYERIIYHNLFARFHPKVVYISQWNGRSVAVYQKALEQDLENPYILQEMRKIIQATDAKPGTKKVQISLLKSLSERNKGIKNISTLRPVRLKVPLEELAKYISYLEERCISSDSIQPYKDLIEIRLLLYTNLPFESIPKIKASHFDIDEGAMVLKDYTVPLPLSFIELVNSVYTDGEYLEFRTPKELNKFLDQTSKAKKCGLSKPIGIKSIKNAVAAVCSKEHLCLKRLPRR